MRQLTKDPNAAAKARAAEQRANEEAGMKSINLSSIASGNAGSGKKKPVFKSTLQPQNAAILQQPEVKSNVDYDLSEKDDDPFGAIANGWYQDRYELDFAADCECQGCNVCNAASAQAT